MKKNSTPKNRNNSLRQRAEAKLDYKPDGMQDKYTYKESALLHEIRVHQIELEMQNEELKQANIVAEKSLSKYYNLYELSPIGYFTIDEHLKILEVNQAGADLLEVKKRFLLNNYFQNFIAKEYLSIFMKFIMKISASKTRHNCEVRLYGKANNHLYVLITGISVKSPADSGNQIWLSVFDITDRIKIEEAKDEIRKLHADENNKLLNHIQMFDKMKTEYFFNISHELRTPLNVILSSLKLLELKYNNLQAEEPINLSKYISSLKQNSNRLLKLINNIIDITKIESGLFEMHLENCNIVSLVENITLSVAEYIKGKGIVVLFDTDIEEKLMACDPDKIERIMLNLLSNAIKFNRPGGTILVNIIDRGESLEIIVSDTGIGIPGDMRELVFQKFQQVDKSLTKEREGSGLGLPLVQSLVEMHGGNISVESDVGKGSKFIIRLPVKTIKPEKTARMTTNKCSGQTIPESLGIEFSDILFINDSE